MNWIDVVDEKRYLMSELNAGRLDVNRWRDFIRFAEKVNCPAMAEDMRGRLEAYIMSKNDEVEVPA
jgi:hypothetical protein